jgi:hypothetical protein
MQQLLADVGPWLSLLFVVYAGFLCFGVNLLGSFGVVRVGIAAAGLLLLAGSTGLF